MSSRIYNSQRAWLLEKCETARRNSVRFPIGHSPVHARLEAASDAGLDPDFIPKLTGDVIDIKVIDRVLTIAGADARRCSR